MGQREEWPSGNRPRGGTGTIPRPEGAAAPRPRRAPEARPAAVPPQGFARPQQRAASRTARGLRVPAAPRPRVAPDSARRVREQPAVAPDTVTTVTTAATEPAPARASAGVASRAAHRMPFLLLVCGLLGGALVCALVISTTLAQGSFQITQLQQQDSNLAKQQQLLEAQVAKARSGPAIEQQAYQLGMRTPGTLRFLDLRDGKVKTDAGRGR